MTKDEQTQNPQETQDPTGNEPEQLPENTSAFRNAFEQQAQRARQAELDERKRQQEEEDAAYQAREDYAKELREDKIDLIKLKQGVISESDKVFKAEAPPKEYTFWQKVGNWFYHAKWWLGIAVFCVVVGAFLVYDYVTREDPDCRVLLLTDNPDFYMCAENLNQYLDTLCEDFNEDGEVMVKSIYVPISKDTMESGTSYDSSYNSQLLVQFQTPTCMLVISDAAADPYLQPEDMFEDLSVLYPDLDCVDGYRLYLDDTNLAEKIGYAGEWGEGTYLALRIATENMNSLEENQEAQARAKILLDALLDDLECE